MPKSCPKDGFWHLRFNVIVRDKKSYWSVDNIIADAGRYEQTYLKMEESPYKKN